MPSPKAHAAVMQRTGGEKRRLGNNQGGLCARALGAGSGLCVRSGDGNAPRRARRKDPRSGGQIGSCEWIQVERVRHASTGIVEVLQL